MASHNQLGTQAENLAAKYFEQHGYTILFRNWRYSYFEIDIIAEKNNKLHIIEVKALSSIEHGYPEEQVNKRKFKKLMQATEEFLYQHPQYRDVQYDILSIVMENGKEPDYFLIEDVYYY